jgi:hypothetical protein
LVFFADESSDGVLFVPPSIVIDPTVSNEEPLTNDEKGNVAISSRTSVALEPIQAASPPLARPVPTPFASPKLYTGAKGDILHYFKNVLDEISRRHPMAFAFTVGLRNVFLRPNKPIADKVDSYLKSIGSSLEEKYVSDPDWLAPYLPRFIPSPEVLLADYDDFVATMTRIGNSDPNDPLLKPSALKELANFRSHIIKGCVSDPPEELVQLYYFTGICPKTGLDMYRCVRGTNCVEGYHQKVAKMLAVWNAGAVLGESLLAWGRWKWNIRASEDNVPGFQRVGHFEHGLMEKCQVLTALLYGAPLPEFA